MRIAIFLLLTAGFLFSCSKDNFNAVPQITFKSISPNFWRSDNLASDQGPVITFRLTDAEGDIGLPTDVDTNSYIFVKNITIAPFKMDSFRFPDLSSVARKNMDVDIDVMIRDLLASSNQPNRPYTDTLFFEIFVRDFARNKSNVITTEPLYYLSP